MKNTQKEKIIVNAEPVIPRVMKLKIKGKTPLLMHKFSDDAQKQILDKQLGKVKQKNKSQIRDIDKEVKDSIHYTPSGKIGIPAISFKNAMVQVAAMLEGLNRPTVKGNVFIIPKEAGLIPLKFKSMKRNCAIVRVQSGFQKKPFIRYRPEFHDWSCELEVEYNSKQVTAEQIFNLVKLAGFSNGVGDFRPQCNGVYGKFEIST